MNHDRSKIVSKTLLAAYALASVTAFSTDRFQTERNSPKPNRPENSIKTDLLSSHTLIQLEQGFTTKRK
jgi:hypothetical protein